ncbi:MAG: rhodanese-like domain-containing protein [Gammaproteobacteria bacterium]|nr:rhodanese-like domain-containing protein [Gammaproteobacteria bacterium]MDH3559423.1 rhodanese-like domain-containing protein [Gammaproteobacteria bacterium]
MKKSITFVVRGIMVALLVWGGSAAAGWANPELIVSADELKKGMETKGWVAVDCRDLKDYAAGHIPGAISFGKQCKKALRDATSRVFRDVSKYEKLFGKVGISNDTHVVFYYDGLKTMNDATVGFWVMEYLGHDKAHVLNGGIDAWRKAGNRLDNKPVKLTETTFKANVKPSVYSSTDEILEIAAGNAPGTQLLDSRSSKEHNGSDIRALRGGHVPNTTLQVSHKDTLLQEKNSKTGKTEAVAYLDADTAAKAFAPLDKNKRVVAHCQTGTRSTMTYLQLRALGFKDPANWDDSWRIYGSTLDYPVEDEQWYNFDGVNKKIQSLEKKVAELEKAKK